MPSLPPKKLSREDLSKQKQLKKSLTLSGHQTSVALEKEFWDELEKLAAEKNISLTGLIIETDSARIGTETLASALRLYVLRELRSKTERP